MRFSLTQFLLFAVLCALLASLASVQWRGDEMRDPIDAAFSPQGRFLAVDFDRGGASVWDLGRGRPRQLAQSFVPSGSATSGLSVLLENDLLAIETSDGFQTRTDIWNLVPGRLVHSSTRYQAWGSMRISPRGEGVIYRDGNAVAWWDLKSNQRRQTVPIPIGYLPLCLAWLDEDSPIAIFSDHQGSLSIWHINPKQATVRTISQLKSRAYDSAISVSPDGEYIACWNAYENKRLELRHARTGKPIPVQEDLLNNPRSKGVFTPDGKHVSILDQDWNLLVWRTSDGKLIHQKQFDETLRGAYWTLSPDTKTLAVTRGQSVELWNLETQKRTYTLWRRSSGGEVFWHAPGLIIWALVFGQVTRRQRERHWRSRAESAPDEKVVPAPPPTVANPRSSWRNVLAVMVSMGVGACVLIVAGDHFAANGRLKIILACVPPLILACLAASVWLRKRSQGLFEAEIARAIQVSGEAGRRLSVRNFRLWLSGPEQLDALFEPELERAERLFAELSGECVRPEEPCLLLYFQKARALDAWFGRPLPLAGFNTATRHERQMALCEETSLDNLMPPHRTLRILLGNQLLYAHKGFWAPVWVSLVVNGHLVWEDQPGAFHRARRHVQAELARNPGLAGNVFFNLSAEHLIAQAVERQERERHRELALISIVAVTIAEHLFGPECGERRERFAGFLKRLTALDRQGEAAFREAFCKSMETYWSEWREWVRQPAPPVYDRPEPIAERHVSDWLLPKLSDPQSSLTERLLIIRSLGASGYLLTASPLIGLLETGADELKEDLIWALECISGERRGDEAAAWREWWQTIPTEMKRQAGSDEELTLSASVLSNNSFATSTRQAVPHYAPRSLRSCWSLMSCGGTFMILWASTVLALFASPGGSHLYSPFGAGRLLGWAGLVAGVFVMTCGASHAARGLRLAAALQMLNVGMCDVANLAFALTELGRLRDPEARKYLAWRRRET